MAFFVYTLEDGLTTKGVTSMFSFVEVKLESGIPAFVFEGFVFQAVPANLLSFTDSEEHVRVSDYDLGSMIVIPLSLASKLRLNLETRVASVPA